jgi:hypothetical protein
MSGDIPEVGRLVRVRGQHWVVTDVQASGLPSTRFTDANARPATLVGLQSVDDDAAGERLTVVWEVEPAARSARPGRYPRSRPTPSTRPTG